MIAVLVLCSFYLTVQSADLPQLPLVPYPQHVSLISSPPAVIDPLRFTFSTQSKSVLLQEVTYLFSIQSYHVVPSLNLF